MTCPSCIYTELVQLGDMHCCPACGWSSKPDPLACGPSPVRENYQEQTMLSDELDGLRLAAVRDLCEGALAFDTGKAGQPPTDRQWLAQSVLNIFDSVLNIFDGLINQQFERDKQPSDECECGGFIMWIDEGDSWGGSCYGQCGDYPRVLKSSKLT